MVTGGLAILFAILGLVMNLLGAGLAGAGGGGPGGGAGGPGANPVVTAMGGIIGAVVGLCWGGIVLSGALKMKSLTSKGYAMAGAITAMIPCSGCCLLGLPFGIWALVVLSDAEVSTAFE
jgi:hypothetical protein